jgi:RNA polymerase sigma-70 factor (ECF subfamily)
MNNTKFNIILPPQDIQENPECLQRIAAGDRTAFEWLYKNYCSKLYDYLFLLTNDKQLSEDIVQDIFLKIWTNKEKLADIKNFNGYIFFITKNLLTDRWRKRQNEKQVLINIAKTTETQTTFTPSKHDAFIYTNAINALTERQQLIYTLIREEGRTREEISAALNLSPNTVKATMQNALRNLKKTLVGS